MYFLRKIEKNTWSIPVYQKFWWYDLQFLRYRAWQTEIDNFGSSFALLPPTNQSNQNFEIMKKGLGDVIILHMRSKNQDDVMYASWDMECHRQHFLSFWVVLCPFTHLTTQKIKILKKWKKHLEILSYYLFTYVYHKWRSYDVWFLRCKVWQTEFLYTINDLFTFLNDLLTFLLSVWVIFSLGTLPLTTWKIKIFKKWKKDLEILLFYHKWWSCRG